MSEASPVVIEAWRGAMAESRHRGLYAVVDTQGKIVDSAGDPERRVYPRSAIKPLQALPLIETGAADAFDVSTKELALACASHGGEPQHVGVVEPWLRRIGLSERDLECGAHAPSHAPSAKALTAAGRKPDAMHNNCSGKHTGMLTACVHLREPTSGYIKRDHPHQQRVFRALEKMCGVPLADAPEGIDGCGLPQLGIPLAALARAYARFGAPDALARGRADACRRLAAAMLAHPLMLAGTGRFCTRATVAAGGKALVKTGAEGVYVAAIPAKGLGIALKIEDGAARAAEVLISALLLRHAGFGDAETAAFQPLLHPPVLNVAERVVGEIRPPRF
jgi:L-asparaginase II